MPRNHTTIDLLRVMEIVSNSERPSKPTALQSKTPIHMLKKDQETDSLMAITL
jgi:hypothetical protein